MIFTIIPKSKHTSELTEKKQLCSHSGMTTAVIKIEIKEVLNKWRKITVFKTNLSERHTENEKVSAQIEPEWGIS